MSSGGYANCAEMLLILFKRKYEVLNNNSSVGKNDSTLRECIHSGLMQFSKLFESLFIKVVQTKT